MYILLFGCVSSFTSFWKKFLFPIYLMLFSQIEKALLPIVFSREMFSQKWNSQQDLNMFKEIILLFDNTYSVPLWYGRYFICLHFMFFTHIFMLSRGRLWFVKLLYLSSLYGGIVHGSSDIMLSHSRCDDIKLIFIMNFCVACQLMLNLIVISVKFGSKKIGILIVFEYKRIFWFLDENILLL